MEGKYIDASKYGSNKNLPDVDIKISPRINIRITYIINNNSVKGIKLSKVSGDKLESITLSNFDITKIIELLSIFGGLDLKSIANKSIVLDKSIINNETQLKSFLELVATDLNGKKKISEVAENYGLLKPGDINNIIQKKESVEFFEKILDLENDFLQYKKLLKVSKDEEVWQKFFSENTWILGTDFVEILDERQLDVENITDYLLKSYDGFVDIIELKLPTAEFWTSDNIPKADLTKATMQCNRYILETERRMNDAKLLEKLGNIPIVKPRITLIYGRSLNWNDDKKEAYRVLNSSYVTLNIITFDHLLERAKRMMDLVDVSGSYTYFINNDVLLAKITPCFENGKLGIARDLKNGIGFGSSEYVVFRPNKELLSEYLLYYLSDDEFREQGRKSGLFWLG